MTSKKIATFLIAIAASILIFSIAYIVKEADHDCSGADCPVCVCIVQCLDNLQRLGTGTEIQTETFIVEKFFDAPTSFYVCLTAPDTLISRKVRLDN